MARSITGKGYLPNLDPLRFLAAAAVVFYHIDNILVTNGYKKDYLSFFPFLHGDIAVVCFFTLSGFLITYLLLKGKEAGHEISVASFYLKRVLRIWPLYFLVIIVAFAVLNYSPYFHIAGASNVVDIGNNLMLNAILLLLIAPNLVLLNTTSLGYANPTWSIGVEEQFYLLWPWLVKSKHFIKYTLAIIIAMYFLSHGIINRISTKAVKLDLMSDQSALYHGLFYLNKFFTFAASFRIDAMALGAVGAYLVVRKNPLLTIIYSRPFQIVTYLALVYTMYFPHVVAYQGYAIIFAIVIVNLATNPSTILKINSRVLNYLGRISYGIYMLHLITIIPVIKVINGYYGYAINLKTELLICLTCLMLSVGVASLSYYTFERIFLSFKNRLK